MVKIPARQVKELRDQTGAGMMDCKKALQEAGGNIENAVKLLREKGLAAAAKKAGRTAAEGLVEAYVHPGAQVGVLVEVNCETDFVARGEQFQQLVHDLSLHIAAMNPQYVRREDVPESVVNEERDILRRQALQENKPEHIIEQIISGRLDKYYERVCLLEQPFIKDTDTTVEELIKAAVARLGENIKVRRFTRYEVGEGIEQDDQDLGAEVAALLEE